MSEYQEAVILAAFNIAVEANGERGYDFSYKNDVLLLHPWQRTAYGKAYDERVVQVTETAVLGSEERIGELEKKLGFVLRLKALGARSKQP